MTLGRRHALGLGLLLALLVEPPLLESLLSAEAQQPEMAARQAPLGPLRPIDRAARQLMALNPWAVAIEPSRPADHPD